MTKSSQLPDGGYIPTFAGNYMMDGFDLDTDYGDGVDAARKDPDPEIPRSNSGLASLPDGFVGVEKAATDEGIDFRVLQALNEDDHMGMSALMGKEAASETERLQDFAWLESAEQDPDRLPQNVNLFEHYQNEMGQTVVEDDSESGTRQELVQAWGVNRRTDGQNLVPNKEYPRPVTPPTSALPGDQFRVLVASAMRRSAFGTDLQTIERDILAHVSDLESFRKTETFRKLAKAIRAIRAEHGLVGNVYLRESAFPALHSGKWDSEIKRRCASARYLLVAPDSKLASHGRYLGKDVVTSIPWGDAVEHYRPILAVQGKRLASGDPREALRAAFLNYDAKERKATNFPVQPSAPEVSSKEARESFAQSTGKPVEEVKLKSVTAAARKKADARIDRWVRAGLLSVEKAREMQARISDPWELYRTASALVATAEARPYEGASFTHHQSEKTASGENLDIRRLLRWASVQMSEGAAGNDLDYLLNARFSGELLKQASEPLVQLRRKHEGLSGHIYVEASAYASPDGTAGCEKGALIHRANAIKAVLGMDRCASCVSNIDDTCQKYNKIIVASAPLQNPQKYQKEMIRLANSDDSEKTAAIFAPTYDASEYELSNDSLDDIEFQNTPGPEQLGDVLFEGLLIDEGD